MQLRACPTRLKVQPHFWCKADLSCEWQSAGSQQLEFCSPVHLPLEGLQAIDLALHRPVAPCMFHCVSTAAQSFLICRTNPPIASSPVPRAFSAQRCKLATLPPHRILRKLRTRWRIVAKPGQRRLRIFIISLCLSFNFGFGLLSRTTCPRRDMPHRTGVHGLRW